MRRRMSSKGAKTKEMYTIYRCESKQNMGKTIYNERGGWSGGTVQKVTMASTRVQHGVNRNSTRRKRMPIARSLHAASVNTAKAHAVERVSSERVLRSTLAQGMKQKRGWQRRNSALQHCVTTMRGGSSWGDASNVSKVRLLLALSSARITSTTLPSVI